MTTLEFLIELGATASEAFVLISVTIRLAGQKYTGKQWYFRMILSMLCYILLVSAMNLIEIFSYATIFVAGVFLLLHCRLFSRGSLLVCLTSVILSLTFLTAFDFFTFFSIGLLLENPVTDARSFMLLMNPGFIRTIYLLVDKGFQLILYLCLRRILPELHRLPGRYTLILFAISSVSLVLECSLTGMVVELLVEAVFSPIGFRVCRKWKENGVGEEYFALKGESLK